MAEQESTLPGLDPTAPLAGEPTRTRTPTLGSLGSELQGLVGTALGSPGSPARRRRLWSPDLGLPPLWCHLNPGRDVCSHTCSPLPHSASAHGPPSPPTLHTRYVVSIWAPLWTRVWLSTAGVRDSLCGAWTSTRSLSGVPNARVWTCCTYTHWCAPAGPGLHSQPPKSASCDQNFPETLQSPTICLVLSYRPPASCTPPRRALQGHGHSWGARPMCKARGPSTGSTREPAAAGRVLPSYPQRRSRRVCLPVRSAPNRGVRGKAPCPRVGQAGH